MSDSFLDSLSPLARERLVAWGQIRTLREGELLIQRGEQGGDVFVIEEGEFEVIDDRHHPAVVLGSAGPGAVLGEMAFVSRAPRSAGVRAVMASRVRVLEHRALQTALDAEPEVGLSFYRTICERMTARHRDLTEVLALGALGRRRSVAHTQVARLEQRARELCADPLGRWSAAESSLRRDPEAPQAKLEFEEALQLLVRTVEPWLDGMLDQGVRAEAGRMMGETIAAWLSRSPIGRTILTRQEGVVGITDLRLQLATRSATGEGSVGEHLEAAICQLPSVAALRLRGEAAARAILSALSPGQPAQIVVIGAPGVAGLLGRAAALQAAGAALTVVESNDAAWSLAAVALASAAADLAVERDQGTLLDLLAGASPPAAPAADLILIDGILDHLPDESAALLLRWAASSLRPDGSMILTVASPSADDTFFEYVLGLPMIRRRPQDLSALLAQAELEATHGVVCAAALIANHRRHS